MSRTHERWFFPIVAASIVAASPASADAGVRSDALLSRSDAWGRGSLVALGRVRTDATPLESAGNILALYVDRSDALSIRVSLVAPVGIRDRQNYYAERGVRTFVLIDEGPGGEERLPAPLSGPAPFAWDRMLELRGGREVRALAATARGESGPLEASNFAAHLESGWLAAVMPPGERAPIALAVLTWADGRELDRLVAPYGSAVLPSGETNVAFVHHANQGLAYTDNFKGRFGAESTSGYDEILRVHEQKNIPGNFHVGTLLQTQAEWSYRNGDPLDFNGWLRTGVTNGWAGMLCSAYGQPIMPFLQGAMNDWAISRDHDMVNTRYGYDPNVAWVPERVFLDPGTYPNAGVIDWSGAHWQANGVNAVILDDAPHLQGHNKHQIHFLSGNGLRMIPRDGDFTGKLHVGDGAGALAILEGEANSGVGQFRITVYADDWEQAAEVSGWENTYPFALDTYLWMIDKCQTESAWLHTWKLDPAIVNANFNGDTFTPTYGTYGGIGDVQGYGGNNNAWYSDWAGYIPYSTGGNGSGGCGGGGNCRNHGQLWNDAHSALQGAPNNNIRESGWYVLMTNLHETAWHDYLGGPISGWQRQYAAHIKNAIVYANAASWVSGGYSPATAAMMQDVDGDGQNEAVLWNQRVFAVFESVGGRMTHLFAKGTGYDFSVIGVDNAYWAGTEGDYNDVNHIAGLSDVGPNTQHDPYSISITNGGGTSAAVTLTSGSMRKKIFVLQNQPTLNVSYVVGQQTEYIQSGWTPDLVDLLYNARMDRVWGGGPQTYMGQRNPNTGATAAYVLGTGGASHNLDFTSTLMKVDEITGYQKFNFLIYAGTTSAPDSQGHVAELEALLPVGDQLNPEPLSGTYYPATHQLVVNFDEAVGLGPFGAGGFSVWPDNSGSGSISLGGATLLTAGYAPSLTFQLTQAQHDGIEAFPNKLAMRLGLFHDSVEDPAHNLNSNFFPPGEIVPISYGPPTQITLDGRFDASEWPACTVPVSDSLDSQWNAAPNDITNEIQALYTKWDDTYLYLGIRGVATANSWLLYLDTDPGGANGQTNLTAIDAWERGATFSAPGFKPDFEFGAYQHQGAFDGQSFFKLLSATTTANYTDSILKAFDSFHGNGLNGGSEIAIPWNVLYGLGPSQVPAGAQIGLVASLCWDPEPAGELGGDQAPNNLAASPPAIDNRVLIPLDLNADGIPDPSDQTPPAISSASTPDWDSVVVVVFDEPVTASSANVPSHYTIYETGNPSQTVSVAGAALQPDQITVRLSVSGLLYRGYTVVASNVRDASCYQNLQPQTSETFQGPPVDVELPGGSIGARLALRAPFPNPARGENIVEFIAPVDGTTLRLEVTDLAGRRVRGLASGTWPAGTHRVRFDGRNEAGDRLAPGLYFVHLSRGSERLTRRFILLP